MTRLIRSRRSEPPMPGLPFGTCLHLSKPLSGGLSGTGRRREIRFCLEDDLTDRLSEQACLGLTVG